MKGIELFFFFLISDLKTDRDAAASLHTSETEPLGRSILDALRNFDNGPLLDRCPSG